VILEDTVGTAAAHWDRHALALQARPPARIRWWEDETTLRHINSLVGKSDPAVGHVAFHERIQHFFGGRTDLKAASVGCGMGGKELWLMQLVGISSFDLYDISPVNIELGKAEAERQGASDRANFSVENAFDAALGEDYDLVYWNNALHHMPDVDAAIQWSRDRLKPGGLFAMDDFVGPSRFQWTDKNLDWASKVRASLSDRYLQNPNAPGSLVSRECLRPTIEAMIADDPSEAADSERILDAIRNHFNDPEIIPTGGALYHLALNDIFDNFRTEDDLSQLRQILLLDQMLAETGTTQYAVAFAVK
jgi:SAM-dependent methyltransferase